MMAVLTLAVVAVPAHDARGEVYEAPYYQTPAGPGNPVGVVGYCDPCWGAGYSQQCFSPADKLGRGVANTLTGWLEWPKHVAIGIFNANVNPIEGIAVGFVRGFGRAVERTGIGLYETFTFPLPGYDPLLCPEFISLEEQCVDWRRGTYSGWCCPRPDNCNCQPQCEPQYPPPCPPQNVCVPRPMSGWNPRPQMHASAGPPPPPQPQMRPIAEPTGPPPSGPAGDRTPGQVTYPDDYLK